VTGVMNPVLSVPGLPSSSVRAANKTIIYMGEDALPIPALHPLIWLIMRTEHASCVNMAVRSATVPTTALYVQEATTFTRDGATCNALKTDSRTSTPPLTCTHVASVPTDGPTAWTAR
jgi:hypothetical protein